MQRYFRTLCLGLALSVHLFAQNDSPMNRKYKNSLEIYWSGSTYAYTRTLHKAWTWRFQVIPEIKWNDETTETERTDLERSEKRVFSALGCTIAAPVLFTPVRTQTTQLYLGLGPVFALARNTSESTIESEDDFLHKNKVENTAVQTSAGLMTLAGVQIHVIDRLSLFTEYDFRLLSHHLSRNATTSRLSLPDTWDSIESKETKDGWTVSEGIRCGLSVAF